MRVIFILILLMAVPRAFADVPGRNWFHLPASKCEKEVERGPEIEPQSPPLNVDDPDTPGCNAWEINVIADSDLANADKSWDLPVLDLNYGIGDDIELTYELPYSNQQSDGVTKSAVGESIAAFKYKFFEDGEDNFQIAFYPQMTFIDPSSAAVKEGVATRGSIIGLPILVAKKLGSTTFGDVQLTGNVGFNLSSKKDVKNFVSAALGIGTALSSNLSIMAELSTEQAIESEIDQEREQVLRTNFGFIRTMNKTVAVLGSVGHSLYASDLKDHTYLLLGLRVYTSNAEE